MSNRKMNIPAHVPLELVRDFDFHMSGEKDIFARWKVLHGGPDIVYSPRYGGHWIFTRHDDIAKVFQDWENFSSVENSLPKIDISVPMPPLRIDPPLHQDFRQLVAPFFTQKSIASLETMALELTASLIESFRENGHCEFMSEFGTQMPIGIFLSIMGIPQSDRPSLLEIAEGMMRGETTEIRSAATGNAFAYLKEKYAERRGLPPRNDMISAILHGTVEGGRPISEDEALGTGVVMLAGGLDTVASMLSFIMMFLAQNNDHRRRLVKSPEIIPTAIEEMMRRFSLTNPARLLVRDIVFKGVTMKAGDMVLVPTTLAGLDERRYEDPLKVDFDRADNKHLLFATGRHSCLGSILARTEIRVFLTEWLKRIPEFEIATGMQPKVVSGYVNVVQYLPLKWDVSKTSRSSV